MSSATTEDVSKLDPELREPYAAIPVIALSEESYLFIRAANEKAEPAPVPDDIEEHVVEHAEVRGRLYRLKGSPVDVPCLIWFHGGGYVMGKPEHQAATFVRYVKALGVSIFAPVYRLSPEFCFPAANDDGFAAWRFIISGAGKKYNCVPPTNKVGLCGSSAGGGLAAAVALQIRDSGSGVKPACLVLNIPWLARPPDTSSDTDKSSWHTVKFNKIWSLSNCRWATSKFLPPGTPNPHHYAFPLETETLEDMPPTHISIAECDILRDSTIEFAQRLFSESVNGAELHVYKGAFHGSGGAVPAAKVSKASEENHIRFLKTVLEL